MTLIVDFHTHILPSMDDGATTSEESKTMLESLKAQGVNHVLLTPHFYPTEESMDSFLSRRNTATQTLSVPSDMKIAVAAEVRLQSILFNYSDLSPLCIPNTDYMLTELDFSTDFSPELFGELSKLNYNYNITPIIAHIERYPAVFEHKSIIESLIQHECMIQSNITSLGMLSPRHRRKLISWMKKGYVHCLGTDCHNMTSRGPNYKSNLDLLQKKVGTEITERLVSAEMILK